MPVRHLKAERAHKMQMRADPAAGTHNIPRILGNFRLHQHNIDSVHFISSFVLSSYDKPVQQRTLDADRPERAKLLTAIAADAAG